MGTELAFLRRALHEFNVTVTPFSKQTSVCVWVYTRICKEINGFRSSGAVSKCKIW